MFGSLATALLYFLVMSAVLTTFDRHVVRTQPAGFLRFILFIVYAASSLLSALGSLIVTGDYSEVVILLLALAHLSRSSRLLTQSRHCSQITAHPTYPLLSDGWLATCTSRPMYYVSSVALFVTINYGWYIAGDTLGNGMRANLAAPAPTVLRMIVIGMFIILGFIHSWHVIPYVCRWMYLAEG